MSEAPTIGRIVLYRTDGRNGLEYDLPAIVNCTRATHPGDYPGGESNPLPVPNDEATVHLTVFTPGGYGTTVGGAADPDDKDFVGAKKMSPGSGTYVELLVPQATNPDDPAPRTWRWPVRS